MSQRTTIFVSIFILVICIFTSIACVLVGTTLWFANISAQLPSPTPTIAPASANLNEELFLGSRSATKQVQLYFIPYCYDDADDCHYFMQTTLPYLLENSKNSYGLQIYAYNVHSSAVPPMMAAFGMLCAAEQGKFKPYLLNYVTWMDHAKFIKSQTLSLSDFELQQVQSVGLNIQQWTACINDQTYRSRVMFRAQADSDKEMVLRLDPLNKAKDLLYPTIEQVQTKLEN